jgi:hypothetical protein
MNIRKIRRCKGPGCNNVIKVGARMWCEVCYYAWRYPTLPSKKN